MRDESSSLFFCNEITPYYGRLAVVFVDEGGPR